MRHRYFGNQLSRPVGQRNNLFRTLLSSLFEKGKIELTLAKAKAIRGQADKLITVAKRQTPPARTLLLQFLTSDMAQKLFSRVKNDFSTRNSGYTRIIRLGKRISDTAEMAVLELIIDKDEKEIPAKTKEVSVPTAEAVLEEKPVKKAKKVVKARAVKK